MLLSVSIGEKSNSVNQESPQAENRSGSPWLWIIAGIVVAFLILLLAHRPGSGQHSAALANSDKGGVTLAGTASSEDVRVRSSRHRGGSESAFTAEEIVARKLSEFGKRRRALVH